MVNLSPAYEPVLLKGLKVHPENPFLFDFIIDTGNSDLKAEDAGLKVESNKLIKYFLASLTVPEKDLWVNLSPYEKDRMIAPNLGQTTMGRDMLAQDYILKQLTASLIYPEKHLGKTFWDEVYAKARQMYGTTQVPVNTFNKVWIVADKADVFERGNAAYIVGAHLKVMLEEDYLALSHHVIPAKAGPHTGHSQELGIHNVASQIIKEIILPQIEKEVNTGKNFAPLRQMFYSMVLSSWYKMALKDAILTQIYGNRSKVKVGVNQADPKANEEIFQRYLRAYKKGVFNYIKDDIDQVDQQPVPRKYFSGGTSFAQLATVERRVSVWNYDGAMKGNIVVVKGIADPALSTAFSSQAMISTDVEKLSNAFETLISVSQRILKSMAKPEDRVHRIFLMKAAAEYLSIIKIKLLHEFIIFPAGKSLVALFRKINTGKDVIVNSQEVRSLLTQLTSEVNNVAESDEVEEIIFDHHLPLDTEDWVEDHLRAQYKAIEDWILDSPYADDLRKVREFEAQFYDTRDESEKDAEGISYSRLWTVRHQMAVTVRAYDIARALDLPDNYILKIVFAAAIHDIGKTGISYRILNFPGRFDDQQRIEMDKHMEYGDRILQELDIPYDIREIALQHHERLDGYGYPKGLKEQEITFGGKILAVADVFTALRETRPYRKFGMPVKQALDIIKAEIGTRFDRRVVDALEEIVPYLRDESFSRNAVEGIAHLSGRVILASNLLGKDIDITGWNDPVGMALHGFDGKYGKVRPKSKVKPGIRQASLSWGHAELLTDANGLNRMFRDLSRIDPSLADNFIDHLETVSAAMTAAMPDIGDELDIDRAGIRKWYKFKSSGKKVELGKSQSSQPSIISVLRNVRLTLKWFTYVNGQILEINYPGIEGLDPRPFYLGNDRERVNNIIGVTRNNILSHEKDYAALLREGNVNGILAKAVDDFEHAVSSTAGPSMAMKVDKPHSENAAMTTYLGGAMPNGMDLEVYDHPQEVNLRGGKEIADIIENNNKRGENSVIFLFTGTRGKTVTQAFVQQIMDRDISLRTTKIFYLDEYWMGKQSKRGRWLNDPRSYNYFAQTNLIKPLNKVGKHRISPGQVFVLNGEANSFTAEMSRWEKELNRALQDKERSAIGAEPKIDIIAAGSGSHGHLAFIEETVLVNQEMIRNSLNPNIQMELRNNNKFLISADVKDPQGAIRLIMDQRGLLRNKDQYKADLREGLERVSGQKVNPGRLNKLVETLRKQKITFYIEGLTDANKRDLESAFIKPNILKSEDMYTDTVGQEELAFSTIIDNYSDFLEQIDTMTGKALTTKFGIVAKAKRVRVFAYGNKTTDAMGRLSVMRLPQPDLPLSVLLTHPHEVKFILDQVAASKIDKKTLRTQTIDLNKPDSGVTAAMTANEETFFKVLTGILLYKDRYLEGIFKDVSQPKRLRVLAAKALLDHPTLGGKVKEEFLYHVVLEAYLPIRSGHASPEDPESAVIAASGLLNSSLGDTNETRMSYEVLAYFVDHVPAKIQYSNIFAAGALLTYAGVRKLKFTPILEKANDLIETEAESEKHDELKVLAVSALFNYSSLLGIKSTGERKFLESVDHTYPLEARIIAAGRIQNTNFLRAVYIDAANPVISDVPGVEYFIKYFDKYFYNKLTLRGKKITRVGMRSLAILLLYAVLRTSTPPNNIMVYRPSNGIVNSYQVSDPRVEILQIIRDGNTDFVYLTLNNKVTVKQIKEIFSGIKNFDVEIAKTSDILDPNADANWYSKPDETFVDPEDDAVRLKVATDKAAVVKPNKSLGGIDLSRSQMNIRKEGQGVQMRFDPAMIARIKRDGFDGIDFHIQSIELVTDLPLLLGIK